MKKAKLFWEIFLWANWLLILGFWIGGSLSDLTGGSLSGVLIALGRLAGLSAAYMVMLQFFFMGRFPWLEKAFGLDKLSRIHERNGKRGIYFLILHPILITLGYSSAFNLSFAEQFKMLVSNSWHIAFALSAFLLFCFVVATSIKIVRSKWRYESWYFVHLLVYLAIFASLPHQFALGHTITSSTIFYGYWFALYTLVFANHLVFRFARPAYLFYKHAFTVERLERESPSAVSVYISGKKLEKFDIHPGQFMIVRFFSKGLWWQAHPFSLSMMPDGKHLRITVKELGDFTQKVAEVKPGTKILIDGPYGVFTNLFSVSNKALFIAGGIGITPVRSLMEEMLRKGKDVVLLYANRTTGDIVFKNELEQLEKKYGSRVVHVLSSDPSFPGEKGLINEEKLKRLVPDIDMREVYLCGPPQMMDSILAVLRKFGLPERMVHFERFSLTN